MKKYIFTLILMTLGITFTGCRIKTNINVNVNSSNNVEETANMVNPIENISDDAEYEKQLGIRWDTSFLSDDIKKSIIGKKVAQASYYIKNTEGEDVEIVLRGTKDASVEKSPVELLAGIYSQDLSEANEVDVTADNSTITFLIFKAPDENMGIEYFNYDDVYYTITYGTSLSQMTIAEINDSVLATIGAK